MTTDIAPASAGVNIDYEAVLKALNLNPRDPKTQALLLVCDRYGLDPVLKHIVLITGNAYVTRDGYLAVAHRSGQFDGMEIVAEGETNTHYTAKVSVYRKDMSRPFTFTGRFPKSKSMAKEFGPEMAIKVAEVQSLRRAFNVTGLGAADERWDVAPDGDAPLPDVTDDGEIIDVRALDDPPNGQQAPHEAVPARPTSGTQKNTDAMLRRIHAVSSALFLEPEDAIVLALGEKVAEEDLTFAQCRKVNDYLTDEQAKVGS